MNANEMMKELGFKVVTDSKDLVIYEKNSNEGFITLTLTYLNKHFGISSHNFDNGEGQVILDLKIIEILNKKMEEINNDI